MTCYDAAGETMIIRGLFEEIVDRMVKKDYAIHPKDVMGGTAFTSWIKIGHDHVTPFEAEGLKLVLDEMLAGRCLSADSTAAGAVRVMPPAWPWARRQAPRQPSA